VTDDVVGCVRRLGKVAARRGQSIVQLALAWVLRHAPVTSVLIGASRVAHVDEAVTMLDNLAFTDAELDEIDAILA
jgi:L-glyceraldehyde 3-phosphate reductase